MGVLKRKMLALACIGSLIAVPAFAQQDLEEVRTEAGKATARFHEVESDHHDVTEDYEASLAEIARMEEEVAVLRKSVATTAIVGFTRSHEAPAVLKSGSPLLAVRADTLGDAALGTDDDSIDAYKAALEDLDIVRAQLREQKASMDALFLQVHQAYAEIKSELAKLEKIEEERLEEIRRRAEQAKNNGAIFVELAVCPLDGQHNFIDSWGFARSGGRRHKGVDMMADTGVPIVAPVAGEVAHRSNRVGGRSFHLKADDGTYFYGTHLSAYGASGSVQAGDIIGYVGDDGNARGLPHLHLEIHPTKGNPTNPYVSVAAVCNGAS